MMMPCSWVVHSEVSLKQASDILWHPQVRPAGQKEAHEAVQSLHEAHQELLCFRCKQQSETACRALRMLMSQTAQELVLSQ